MSVRVCCLCVCFPCSEAFPKRPRLVVTCRKSFLRVRFVRNSSRSLRAETCQRPFPNYHVLRKLVGSLFQAFTSCGNLSEAFPKFSRLAET